MPETSADPIALLPHPGPDQQSRRLLLFAIRRLAAAGLNDAHAANAIVGGFGLSFRRPLVLLRALMAEISRASSQRLLVAPCCCPRMTDAEASLLAAVCGSRNDPRGAHALLSATLGVENCLGALSSAQALDQAFSDLGRPLG